MPVVYVGDIHDIRNVKTVSIETVYFCNRKCEWCPNKDRELSRDNVMTDKCFDKIIDELSAINYAGEIHPYFRNEPGCDPHIVDKIYKLRLAFSQNVISVHTNGDYGKDFFKWIPDPYPGANRLQVNKYDDPRFRQSQHFRCFSNRAGKVEVAPEKTRKQCSFPMFKIMIMYDGNVPLCCNDWDCEIKLGNILEKSLMDIWNSETAKIYRNYHAIGRGKELVLCKKCNHI